jgi:glycerophosphoryl diester phosphodiesterase
MTTPTPAVRVTVIAHRGASTYAPENTLAAFDLALRQGARHVELDVHLTRDGEVVVIHDDKVDRTTNGTGPVAGFALADLQALDAGVWFGAAFAGERIPTLDAVLARYRGRAHLHVELKARAPTLADETAARIRRHGMADAVTISSFQRERLEESRRAAPELARAWLVEKLDDEILAQARPLELAEMAPLSRALTPDWVARLRAAGYVVRAWGIGNEEIMRRTVEIGADGMTVNFPDKLIAFLQERGIPRQ